MEDIWQQFHRLPRAIRDAVATPAALAAVERLEQQYPGLDLAYLIMQVMVKEAPFNNLPQQLQTENKLTVDQATSVVDDLRQQVFTPVSEYLGLTKPPPLVSPPPPSPPDGKGFVAPTARPITKVVPPPSSLPVVLAATSLPATPLKPRPITPTQPASPPTVVKPAPSLPRLPVAPVPTRPNIAPTQAYSEEDAQEIATHAAKLKTISAPGVQDFDTVARQVMEQHELGWPEELLQKRAVAMFKARLKEIRNSDDTKAMLIRPPKVGGLGMDEDLAAQVVTTLEKLAGGLKQRGMVRPPEPIPLPPPPVVPTVTPTKPAPMPPLQRMVPGQPLPSKPVPPIFTPTYIAPAAIKRPADIPAPPVAAPKLKPAPTPPPVIQRPRMADRPKMADITRPTKTLGPAEEMRSLSVTEFRRLGQGAAESTRKLLEKFHHLQQESFTLWAEAVAGWRQSEVHQVYLAMGRQSLEQGAPITEVVQQRARLGQPYLSEHEFTSLADLNRQLQF